jgi:hypothetical protein
MKPHKSQSIEMDKNEVEMFLYRKTNAKNRNFKQHTIFILFFWAGLYLIKKTNPTIENQYKHLQI